MQPKKHKNDKLKARPACMNCFCCPLKM